MARGGMKGAKAVAVPASEGERVSVSVRPIKNGFVATHTRSGPKGYTSEEVYHPTKPTVQVGPAAKKVSPKGKPRGR